MIIIKTATELSAYVQEKKKGGKTVGFVPTMGALHQGHISLIQKSREDSSLTLCSIFINPTQFNSKEDLRHYPVTIEKDIEQLINARCDVLFLPVESEIYPPDSRTSHYSLGELDLILEGHFRPGHFQGVCQAVDRLLEIVKPDFLYLGQKDYQQCMVIARLIEITGKKDQISLKIAPTIREKDGLAMSSRNLRLTAEQRLKALAIYREMSFIKEMRGKSSLNDLKGAASRHLIGNGFAVDYVEIANADTLQPAQSEKEPLVILVAAFLDNIRLIDNMLLN